MSSVEQSRTIATRFWRGELPRRRGRYSGLNSEPSLRSRMHKIALAADADPDTAAALRSIDFLRGPADQVLEATETLLDQALPAYFPTAHTLLDVLGNGTWPLVDLLVVQSLGARQGHWIARDEELADARLARDLYRDAPPFDRDRQNALLNGARHAYQTGRHFEAVSLLAEADRGERIAVGLLQMAVALWRAGNPSQALHVARVCLLEEPETFPTAESLLSALKVESSLRRALEGHGAASAHDVAALKVIHDPHARASYGPRARSA